MRRWNTKTNLAHALDLRVLCVEVLLKLWQLIQVPSFFTETFARIPKLRLCGSTATTDGPKARSAGGRITGLGSSLYVTLL